MVLGWGTGKAQRESNSTMVAVNIAESIAVVAWPDGFLDLDRGIMPGEEVVSPLLTIGVKANSLWGIEISCDLPDGRMKEYDQELGAYVPDGSLVTHPMEWSAASSSGPWEPLSVAPSSIVANQTPTGDSGEEVKFYLRFVADYGDRPLPPGLDYRIVVQYTAGLNF